MTPDCHHYRKICATPMIRLMAEKDLEETTVNTVNRMIWRHFTHLYTGAAKSEYITFRRGRYFFVRVCSIH